VLRFWQDTIAALSFAGQGACLPSIEKHNERIYDWLSRQHHGSRILQLFRQTLSDLSERGRNKKALYALLSHLVGSHIDAFDKLRVPAAKADPLALANGYGLFCHPFQGGRHRFNDWLSGFTDAMSMSDTRGIGVGKEGVAGFILPDQRLQR
jgi:hypothetical protein